MSWRMGRIPEAYVPMITGYLWNRVGLVSISGISAERRLPRKPLLPVPEAGMVKNADCPMGRWLSFSRYYLPCNFHGGICCKLSRHLSLQFPKKVVLP
jgi:hypothetical protein